MGCAYSSHNDHQRSKKKSSSTNNNNNNNANQGDDNGDLSSSSSPRTDQESTTNQRRIFDATYVSMNGHKQSGQIEITDNELIFHYGDNKHLDWPLKYIRGYGCSSNLFSFECGRKCSTGQGHHRFECTRAIQLQQQLMHQIEIMSSMLSQRNHRSLHHHNNNLSNLQQHFHSHSHLINNNDSMPSHNNNNTGRLSSSHEYQNLSSDTTLPRPGSYAENATNSSNNDNHMVIPSATTRSSSSTGVHTYLNSSVINGQMKSEPNYYSTNPISSSSSHNNSIILNNNANNNGETSSLCLNDSKYSLNDIGSSLSQINDHRSNRHNHSYDSRTLPSSMMRNNNANKNSKTLHSYVNTTTIENMINNNCDDNASIANRTRRSSDSNQNHLYLNYDHISDNNGNNLMNEINAKKLQQIQSKIDESDNLGTFCFVNFDRNVIKNRKSAIAGLKNRFNNSSKHNVNGSRIATPESYVQLDLNNKMNGGDVLSKNFNDINDDDMINNNNNNSRKCSTSSMNDYLNIDTNNLPKIARINDKFSCIVGNNINNHVNNNDNNNNQMNTLERIRRNSTNNNNNNNNNYITITTTTTNNNNSNNNCLPQQSSTTMTSSLLSSTTAPATGTTVPYAQIDFAKTLALQASTASHRKL